MRLHTRHYQRRASLFGMQTASSLISTTSIRHGSNAATVRSAASRAASPPCSHGQIVAQQCSIGRICRTGDRAPGLPTYHACSQPAVAQKKAWNLTVRTQRARKRQTLGLNGRISSWETDPARLLDMESWIQYELRLSDGLSGPR